MKKFAFVLVLLCAAISVWAQDNDYSPMLKDGRVWKVIACQEVDGKLDISTITYMVDSRDMIEGKDCYRLTRSISKEFDKTEAFDFVCYMYEEDRCVYRWDEGKWKLEFDFNLRGGDMFEGTEVSRADMIKIEGKEFFCIYVDCYRWLEGVGNDCTGPLNTLPFSFDTKAKVKESVCYLLRDEGNTVFDLTHLLMVNPTYAASIMAGVEWPQNYRELCDFIFDLHGRRLTSKPEKGVYIEGGRKHCSR